MVMIRAVKTFEYKKKMCKRVNHSPTKNENKNAQHCFDPFYTFVIFMMMILLERVCRTSGFRYALRC